MCACMHLFICLFSCHVSILGLYWELRSKTRLVFKLLYNNNNNNNDANFKALSFLSCYHMPFIYLISLIWIKNNYYILLIVINCISLYFLFIFSFSFLLLLLDFLFVVLVQVHTLDTLNCELSERCLPFVFTNLVYKKMSNKVSKLTVSKKTSDLNKLSDLKYHLKIS